MKRITCLFIIIFMFSVSGLLRSQDVAKDLDGFYGLDQTLCNGKKYLFSPPPGCKGHQYLLSPLFLTGTATIRGKCYRNLSLNYDVFNHQLLLRYADQLNPFNIIEVSKAWLTGFTLGEMTFVMIDPERDSSYYQVLGEGPVRIMYYWRKTLSLDGNIGNSYFNFSPAIRESYVFMDGALKPFSSRRSLLRLFDRKHRAEIKSYLHKNRIKVKKAPDAAMAEMITQIGKLK